MKIFWTEKADLGLNSIFRYREDPTAKRFIYKILEEVKILSKFPKAAPVLVLSHVTHEEYRSLVVAEGNYKIIYLIDEENRRIVVLDVWDCRQSPENLINK